MRLASVVLWDVGGTLVDYAMSEELFLRRCLEPVGIPLESLQPEDIAAARATRRGLEASWRTPEGESAGYREVASILLRNQASNREQIALVADTIGRYFDLYSPVDGICALLGDLRDAGVVQGIISNWPPSLRSFLEYHELSEYFTSVVVSGELGVTKPNLAIFEQALTELGVMPDQCVYVGDNPGNDVLPAQRLGMKTIHFNPRRNHATADEREVVGLRSALFSMLALC